MLLFGDQATARLITGSGLKLSSEVMFEVIDHIGIAVEDLDVAIQLRTNAYGLPLVHGEVVEEQGLESVLLDVGESHIELLAPLSADTPVGKSLTKKGPGLHHVAYRVDDVAADLSRVVYIQADSDDSRVGFG